MNEEYSARIGTGVDRRSPMPAYHQLARILRGRIDRGEWHDGQQLPTEIELAEGFEVSRSTVRQALTQLESESYVRREHGRGTFAAPPARLVMTDLSLPLGLAHRTRAQGLSFSAVQRALELAPLRDAEISRRLRQERGVPTVRFERAIRLDGRVAAISTSWLPADRFGSIVADGLREESISLTLREVFGVDLARYENEIEVRDADPESALALGIAPTDSVLVLTAACLSSAQDVVEVSCTSWRADMVRLRFGIDVI